MTRMKTDPRRDADTGLDPAHFSDRVRAAFTRTRDPLYEPRATVEVAQARIGPNAVPPMRDDELFPLAYPAREMLTVERFRRAAQGVTTAGGVATLELGVVPENQTWIVERFIARGGAAGQALLYAGGANAIVNDLDLFAVVNLAAPAFAGQADGNPFTILPGTPVNAVFIGAGNALPVTANLLYAIGVWERSGHYGSYPGD